MASKTRSAINVPKHAIVCSCGTQERNDVGEGCRRMLVGYARVSLPEQQLALQEDALRQAGCEKIYTDTVSGKHQERPGLTQALEVVRTGDTLVAWKLDRLGRSLAHLVS